MDTKERKAGIQTGPKRPARRPYRTRFWHPAHRSRGEKRLRKPDIGFKRGPKIFLCPTLVNGAGGAIPFRRGGRLPRRRRRAPGVDDAV